MELSSWQLTEFVLEGQIAFDNNRGLVKILRADDGTLTLVEDADHGRIDPDKPTPIGLANSDSILAFVLDIGVRRERQLTYGSGFYFGNARTAPQSTKPVSQRDFDGDLFERIAALIDRKYQSGDKRSEAEAMRIQLLLHQYNDARLLFPSFFSESYLALMRIVDALNPHFNAEGFATYCVCLDVKANSDIYARLKALPLFAQRLRSAVVLFEERLARAETGKWAVAPLMVRLDEASRVLFACFYSAYKYRNTFVHHGFPFPATVKEVWGAEANSATAYLSGTLGISWMKTHRPEGLEPRDLIDIHQALEPADVERFRKEYFLLLPTWQLMKDTARAALTSSFS